MRREKNARAPGRQESCARFFLRLFTLALLIPSFHQVKHKMMYASTKDHFKGHLDGLGVELQASEVSDLAEADVAEAVRASVTRQ